MVNSPKLWTNLLAVSHKFFFYQDIPSIYQQLPVYNFVHYNPLFDIINHIDIFKIWIRESQDICL